MKDFIKYVLASITGYIILMVLLTFLGIAMLVSAALSGDKPQPVKAHSILQLNMSGEIVERAKNDPLSELSIFDDRLPKEQGLNEIIDMIDKAAADDNIDGIYIKHGGLSAGLATCSEIRNALMRFKESGKFIYSYAAYYSQKNYYIASVSDSIFLNPGGGIDLRGFASEQMFFTKMLEKYDVEVNVIKYGKYKSAVEPFFNEKNSPENAEQLTVLLNGFWNDFASKVESSRGISKANFDAYANSSMLFQDIHKNIEYHLADALTYYDEVESAIKKRQGKDDDDKLRFVSLGKYKNALVDKKKKKNADDKVAVVYASGAIDGGSQGINSAELAETLRDLQKKDHIKALVLRVNSPGGGAYGSEQIWHEIVRLKEKMPVVVSMGDVAASGGYYISCAADSILVSPSTITGSIGAFAVFMKLGKTFERFGITTDRVKTHDLADMNSVFRSTTFEEKQLMQGWLDRMYVDFATRCGEGRGMSFESIDSIGQGRIWTGTDAISIGLADAYGGLHEAIQIAANMAELQDFQKVEYPKQKTIMEQLIDDMQMSIGSAWSRMRWGTEMNLYQQAQELLQQEGAQMRLPYEITIQ